MKSLCTYSMPHIAFIAGACIQNFPGNNKYVYFNPSSIGCRLSVCPDRQTAFKT